MIAVVLFFAGIYMMVSGHIFIGLLLWVGSSAQNEMDKRK